ncbi:MAG: Gfo/Idh/MocA family oxidoreductase [Acidimicrobiia bacterium]
MADDRLGVGIIGMGNISFFHEMGFMEIEDRCRLVAMCDADEATVRLRAGNRGCTPYTRYEDLLADPAVDLVDVIVPHPLHHDVVLAAIDAGKHVVVEKPIAVTSDQGREMIERAERAGVTFTVAENTRFVPAYRAVERLLGDGTIGDVWTVRTLIAGSEVEHIRDPAAWHGTAPWGGVIIDSAVHSFYLLRWLFGGALDARAFASKVVPEGEMEDNALILGRLRNGAEYQVYVTCTAEIPWTERLEVYGSTGGIVVDHLVDPVVRYYHGSDDIEGKVVESVPFDPFLWKGNSMFAELRDVVDAVRERRAPTVDPRDALHAVRAAEAAMRSVGSDRPEPVEEGP